MNAEINQEISNYAAQHGLPLIHGSQAVTSTEDIEVRRLRNDLSFIRNNLENDAGPYPDGTGKVPSRFSCGHPKDPGYTLGRHNFLARYFGLAHPELVAVSELIAAWESRLPHDFVTVREEYLEWYKQKDSGMHAMMFGDWIEEYTA